MTKTASTLLSILFLSLFTSCAHRMTAREAARWRGISATANGVNKVYQTMEYQKQRRNMLNYKYQQQAKQNQYRQPSSTPACDVHCEQQKHNLRQKLLYIQMQNSTGQALNPNNPYMKY